jgi:hypothetical protein
MLLYTGEKIPLRSLFDCLLFLYGIEKKKNYFWREIGMGLNHFIIQ